MSTTEASKALLSVTQARDELGGIGTTTFYALVADGDLPLVKIRSRSFVRRADLDALVERSTRELGSPTRAGRATLT